MFLIDVFFSNFFSIFANNSLLNELIDNLNECETILSDKFERFEKDDFLIL